MSLSSEEHLRHIFAAMREASQTRETVFLARQQALGAHYRTFLSGDTSTLDIIEHLRNHHRMLSPYQQDERAMADFETLLLVVPELSQHERTTDPFPLVEAEEEAGEQECKTTYISTACEDACELVNQAIINHWCRCKAQAVRVRVSPLNVLSVWQCENPGLQVECDANLDEHTAVCFSPCYFYS